MESGGDGKKGLCSGGGDWGIAGYSWSWSCEGEGSGGEDQAGWNSLIENTKLTCCEAPRRAGKGEGDGAETSFSNPANQRTSKITIAPID